MGLASLVQEAAPCQESSTWAPPANTPAGRVMSAIGGRGNMENLLLVQGHVNWVKGQLFSRMLAGCTWQRAILSPFATD
jgi:hypothetical protein